MDTLQLATNPALDDVKRRMLAAKAAGWSDADIQKFAVQDIMKQRGITPAVQNPAISQPNTTDAFGIGSSTKVTPDQARQYVFDKASKEYGWSQQQLDALNSLITRESGWQPTVQNKSSGAFGLFQFVPMHWGAGKLLPNGPNSNLADQTTAGLKYIAQRYGNPANALKFWLSRQPINGKDVGNWY